MQSRRSWAVKALRFSTHPDALSAALGALDSVVHLAALDGAEATTVEAVRLMLSQDIDLWPAWPAGEPEPPTGLEREARLEEARRGEVTAQQTLMDQQAAAKWGGALPTERMRRAGWAAKAAATMERPLLDVLADLPDERLRDVTRWLTRRVLEEARLTEVPWVAAALAAREEGRPLPPPFDGEDPHLPWVMLDEDPAVAWTTYDGEHGRMSVQHMALTVLSWHARGEVEEEALAAVAEAFWAGAATFGPRRHQLVGDLRAAFAL